MLNKNIKEKISLKINDYKIYIYIHEDNLYIEILSSKNKGFFYYDSFSFKILSNNKILKKYKNIQEIYYFLKQVIQNSKDNHLIIEEYKNIFNFIINENITFRINKEDDEKEDDSIFKNNLNNFENILNEIENDMNNLDPYIKELKEKNEKITEENIKLKKEIEALNQENEKLKQELNNKINSKNNLISSKNENGNKEIIKNENENNVKTFPQKSKQEIKNYYLNKKNSIDNLISYNNNLEKKNFDNENKNSKDENPIDKKELKKSESIKNKENIFSIKLQNQLSNYIKEIETFKKKIISFELLYKASTDNDSATSFHNKVDNKGPILIIIKTIDDKIIGGFSSKPWSSNNEYIEDKDAFLFSYNNVLKKKFKINFENRDNACFHNKDEGPHFGKNALIIKNNCLKNENMCATDTYKFSVVNLMGKMGSSKFKIKDYEVYNIIS